MTAAPIRKPLSPHEIVKAGLCIGCGSCASAAGNAAMGWDRYGFLKPRGDWSGGAPASFADTCPFAPDALDEDSLASRLFPEAAHVDGRIGRFQAAYVGHVAEGDFRSGGSSGGMVSWVAAELMRRGLVDGVAHVVASRDPQREGRFFHYRISRSEAELREGAKSRYYPVELSGVLREIRGYPGRYAVVGVPCFIKAINLRRRAEPVLAERIAFTLGLYCGHMKSARMVESFAWQMGLDAGRVTGVEYRVKNRDRPANWYTAELTLDDGARRRQDWWHLVDGDWGSGFFQNAACNFCDDVVAETADISFGDAWVEPYSSDGRGTNVVVIRSPLLGRIVDEAIVGRRLELKRVDADFIVETQAAGFRQRREGLSYRLSHRRGLRPKKRVPPCAPALPLRRKLIYLMRTAISAGSHPVFAMARRLDRPRLYLTWGRAMLAIYQGLAYSRGGLGKLFDRLVLPDRRG